MPLEFLGLNFNTMLSDLGPLKGMPLRDLSVVETAVTDLTPLEGMELRTLGVSPERIEKGMDAIRTMASLKQIRVQHGGDPAFVLTPAEFWKRYDAGEWAEKRKEWLARRAAKPRVAKAARVKTPPAFDGKLGEGEYGAAERQGGFVILGSGRSAPTATEFAVAYDDRKLYILIVASEKDPPAVLAQKANVLWLRDHLEVFVDANHDRLDYVQFGFDLAGQSIEILGGPGKPPTGVRSEKSGWKVAVAQSRDAFLCELAVPFRALGIEPPKPGDKWGLNVCRQRGADGDQGLTQWNRTDQLFHEPQNFGELEF